MISITWQWCTVSCSFVYLSVGRTDGSDRWACLSCSAPWLVESVKVLSDWKWDVFIRWHACLMHCAIDNRGGATSIRMSALLFQDPFLKSLSLRYSSLVSTHLYFLESMKWLLCMFGYWGCRKIGPPLRATIWKSNTTLLAWFWTPKSEKIYI